MMVWSAQVSPKLLLISQERAHRLTECSSCLTSKTVPSLNFHFTISASSDVPLTHSLESSLVQNFAKSGSLMRCQTSVSGASMTADSVTALDVGIWADMVMCSWFVDLQGYSGLCSRVELVVSGGCVGSYELLLEVVCLWHAHWLRHSYQTPSCPGRSCPSPAELKPWKDPDLCIPFSQQMGR